MRHFIIIGFLLAAVTSPGQIYIDSYRFAQTGADLLLDSFPGAAAAYSLRKLDKDYAGNAIMVRRSSDGDSLNIGFSGNYLDTTAMKTFCGTTSTDSCFVQRWYDQSGNGVNTMKVSGIDDPMIVTAGAIIYTNNQVAVDFRLFPELRELRSASNLAINLNNGMSIFSVMHHNRQAVEYPYSITSLNNSATYITGPYRNAVNQNTSAFRWTTQVNNLISSNIVFLQKLDAAFVIPTGTGTGNFSRSLDGASLNTVSVTWTTDPVNQVIMGQYRSNTPGFYFSGTLQELIIYPSNQVANKSNIEGNINNFYSIY
jgi:hypothetical protein